MIKIQDEPKQTSSHQLLIFYGLKKYKSVISNYPPLNVGIARFRTLPLIKTVEDIQDFDSVFLVLRVSQLFLINKKCESHFTEKQQMKKITSLKTKISISDSYLIKQKAFNGIVVNRAMPSRAQKYDLLNIPLNP